MFRLALITCEKDLTIRSLLISLFLAPSQILPTWLAPNLITFTGFMFLVLTFTLLSFFDFDFYASGEVNKPCVYDCFGFDVLVRGYCG